MHSQQLLGWIGGVFVALLAAALWLGLGLTWALLARSGYGEDAGACSAGNGFLAIASMTTTVIGALALVAAAVLRGRAIGLEDRLGGLAWRTAAVAFPLNGVLMAVLVSTVQSVSC